MLLLEAGGVVFAAVPACFGHTCPFVVVAVFLLHSSFSFIIVVVVAEEELTDGWYFNTQLQKEEMSEATEQLFGVGLTDAAINPKRLLNPVESNSGETGLA